MMLDFCAQNLDTILGSIMNIIERAYAMWKGKKSLYDPVRVQNWSRDVKAINSKVELCDLQMLADETISYLIKWPKLPV
jgi:hypothetical protein